MIIMCVAKEETYSRTHVHDMGITLNVHELLNLDGTRF